MPYGEAFRLALATIRSAKLRSFFTLLGIIVSVGFLVTVVAIIQGMNSYVQTNLTDAMIGTNAFQVRRTPITVGLLSDEEMRRLALPPEHLARATPRRSNGRCPTPKRWRCRAAGRRRSPRWSPAINRSAA